jgi:hypothetical protein
MPLGFLVSSLQKAEGMDDVVIDFMEQVQKQEIPEESEEDSKDEQDEPDFNEVAHKMDTINLTEFFKENPDIANLMKIDPLKELPMISRIIG